MNKYIPEDEVPDFRDFISRLCPQHDELREFHESLADAGLVTSKDEDGKVWIESAEYGLFRPEFLIAFMRMQKCLTN
ncbi:hypothetical protein [uncultured Megasphaera sp.]|jgi:hypothetical protein|uniref:hypothetical protein n=1 Tax=uncultured Megasphaera sp. TaxID=165188 RepID=UPI00204F3341|nr:hypothetical protein [uncultured Megasphaera sp.]DAJ17971.1 MAG TPA: hypothetical protein [Siphoviridae sp. ct4aE30]